MLSSSENILRAITGKSSWNDVTTEELQVIAEENPYFSAAQFLSAKKSYLAQHANCKTDLQKTALHFSNLLWFHYNLTEEVTQLEEVNQTEIDTVNTPEGIFNDKISPEEVTVSEEISKPEININQLPEIVDSELNGIDIKDEKLQEEDAKKIIQENEELNINISNLLKEQAAEFEKPVGKEEELVIENTPYHRVDYFDSQGIKLEEKADDKLGNQLKRFTDWLKQMKRVNPNPSDLGTDSVAESQVQHMAEHSNQRGDVVTEAMAEVLIKQGKPEQAISIYEKLSFNNPPKSAYFAAKIQELKG